MYKVLVMHVCVVFLSLVYMYRKVNICCKALFTWYVFSPLLNSGTLLLSIVSVNNGFITHSVHYSAITTDAMLSNNGPLLNNGLKTLKFIYIRAEAKVMSLQIGS